MAERGYLGDARTDGIPLLEQRRRLLIQLTGAVTLVVVLLAGLSLYDLFAGQAVEPEASVVAEQDASPGTSAAAEAKPSVDVEPAVKQGGETGSSTAMTTLPAGIASAAPDVETAGKAAIDKPEQAQAETAVSATAVSIVPASVAPVAASAGMAEPKQPPIAASPGGRYLLQAGMFADGDNAQELATRLRAAGVPVRIETRVQVGPFADRQTAETARKRLEGLGVPAMPLPPQKR